MKKLNIKNKVLFVFALIAVFAIGGFLNLKEAKVAIADGGGLDYNDLIFEGEIEQGGFRFVLTKDSINSEEKFVIKEGEGSINWRGNKFVGGPSGIESMEKGNTWWRKTKDEGKYEFQMILNMNPKGDNKLTDYGINFWVLKGQVVKEARKGAEGTFDFFIKEATAQILLGKEKKIEHPKIIFNGEVKIAPFGELSEIAQGEIRTTLEEPTEGLSGEITLNNFHYEITKDQEGRRGIIFEGREGDGEVREKSEKKILKNVSIKDDIKIINISENQDKNLFSFVIYAEEEGGAVYWDTKGAVIEGINKNYFIGEVEKIEEEGKEPRYFPENTKIRLTGEFEKKQDKITLSIKSYDNFEDTTIKERVKDELVLKIDQTEKILIPENITEGSDPRLIWSIVEPKENMGNPAIEFVEIDGDNNLCTKGLRMKRKAFIILNNTNINTEGEEDWFSYYTAEVATPEIPTGEITRIEFGKDFMGDGFIGVEGIFKEINLIIKEGEPSEEAVPSGEHHVYAWWEGREFNNSVIGTYYRNYQYKDHYGNESGVAKRTIEVLSPGTTTKPLSISVDGEGKGILPPVLPEEEPTSMIGGSAEIPVTIDFPAEGLTITGEPDWNGIIKIPTVVRTPVQPSPSSGMRTENVYSIEVGGNTPLLFDKPVKITFIGKAGHLVGWSRDGKFTPVTNICNPVDGSGLGEGADCKIDSGRDLVVWTRHMTVYTIYTESSIPRIGYRPAESITTITPIIEAAPEGQVLGAEKYNFTLLLKTGSRGTEVEELQKFLNDLGFDCGKVDGIFGKNTFAGVIAYQLSNKLKVDGIVGPETRGFLNK